MKIQNTLLLSLLICGLLNFLSAAERARDMGIEFFGTPGKNNAITDVQGVTVGYSTIIKDLEDGKAVRTGVTAIFPRGYDSFANPVIANYFSLNGNGEMTGTQWLKESGFLQGPIMVTNTKSVGTVYNSLLKWSALRNYEADLPVVTETWDGRLNDVDGLHVEEHHVFEALDNAQSGPIQEGNVGSGTGMVSHRFKGGIGTASRVTTIKDKNYTVGVWVQANHGLRHQLLIQGKPIGRWLPENIDQYKEQGSIVIIIATDAPLTPTQMRRLAVRATMGLARTGSVAENSSGDIFLAFSTANSGAFQSKDLMHIIALKNEDMDPLFEATVEATEEAIINALVAAKTMKGHQGHSFPELDKEFLKKVFRQDKLRNSF